MTFYRYLSSIPNFKMQKLPLTLIDPDKTYDILFYDKIASSVISKLSGYFKTHSFLNQSSGIIVLDRYTPDGFKWANNWANKVAGFLKPLTASWVIEDDELNGRAYGFNSPFDVADLNNIPLEAIPDKFYVRVKRGKPVKLSWLENAYPDENTTLFYDGVAGQGIEYTKKTKIIASYTQDLTFEINCENWLFNSLVIDGNCLILRTENKNGQVLNDSKVGVNPSEFLSGLLYDSLDWVLGNITSLIGLPENIEVLTGFTATLETTFQIYEGARRAATRYLSWDNANAICPLITNDFVRYSSPVYQQLPSHYYHIGLLRGENNIWKDKSVNHGNVGREPATIWDDSYKTFFYKLGLVFDYFTKWRNTINSDMINGYDDWNDGIKRRIFTMSLLTPALGDWGSVEFFTETANQNPLSPLTWNPYSIAPYPFETYVKTSYPNLHTHNTDWLTYSYRIPDTWGNVGWRQPFSDLTVNTNGLKKCYRFHLINQTINSGTPTKNNFYQNNSALTSPFEWYSFNVPGEYGYNGSGRITNQPQYYNFTGLHRTGLDVGIDGYGRKIIDINNYYRDYYYRFNAISIECLGCLDYNLFSFGEIALLRQSVDIFFEGHSQGLAYDNGYDWESEGFVELENYRQEKLVKQGIKFLVNSTDSENPDIIPTFLPANEQVIFENTTMGFQGIGVINGIPSNQLWNQVNSSYSITLNRQLRTSPVNTPLYWERDFDDNGREVWTQSDYENLLGKGQQIQEDFTKDTHSMVYVQKDERFPITLEAAKIYIFSDKGKAVKLPSYPEGQKPMIYLKPILNRYGKVEDNDYEVIIGNNKYRFSDYPEELVEV